MEIEKYDEDNVVRGIMHLSTMLDFKDNHFLIKRPCITDTELMEVILLTKNKTLKDLFELILELKEKERVYYDKIFAEVRRNGGGARDVKTTEPHNILISSIALLIEVFNKNLLVELSKNKNIEKQFKK